ncbi:HigA family addiction module antidote protein [bacterium]|nr:HigA family addiction module antidote protein [bacterium]
MGNKRIILTSGDILRIEFLEPLNITAYRLAKDIGVSAVLIGNILKGKQRISVDLALKLALYFETTPQFWLNIQNFCDLDKLKDTYEKEKLTIIPFSKRVFA